MPQGLPPAGTDGLPPISTRAFQLIDAGYPVWSAFWDAFNEWLNAVIREFGSELGASIGEIG